MRRANASASATITPVRQRQALEPPAQLLLSVEDAMAVLSMTRPRFYREVNRDRIKTIKDGKRRLVPYLALVDYTRRLCAENGFSYDELAG